MLEHFLEEIDGALTYYELYEEHKGQEVAYDLYGMACDELRHANFWLGLLSFTDEYEERYSDMYDEADKKIHGDGGMHDVLY